MIKHSQRQALKAKAWQPRSVDGSWLHLKFSPLTPSKHLKIRLFWFFGLFFYTTGPFFVLFFYTMPLQSRLEHSSKKSVGSQVLHWDRYEYAKSADKQDPHVILVFICKSLENKIHISVCVLFYLYLYGIVFLNVFFFLLCSCLEAALHIQQLGYTNCSAHSKPWMEKTRTPCKTKQNWYNSSWKKILRCKMLAGKPWQVITSCQQVIQCTVSAFFKKKRKNTGQQGIKNRIWAKFFYFVLYRIPQTGWKSGYS